jgi:hypothetical protein
MTNSENRNIVEMHGCIVCSKIFNLLVVYSPDGSMVDCVVTSPGGHRVPDERQPLVACDVHPVEKIESAYKRWQSRNGKAQND